MTFILVHLPGLWGFWDGAAAGYVWNRNVLLSVAKGWFTGIVIGVIFPFVSSSGIFCPCAEQKINFKNPVEPVTCKSSEWGEVQGKLKQFISGVGEAGMNAELLSLVWVRRSSLNLPCCGGHWESPSQNLPARGWDLPPPAERVRRSQMRTGRQVGGPVWWRCPFLPRTPEGGWWH